MTIGRWSWKSKSDNECVTTHQSNPSALKMNEAKTTVNRESTVCANIQKTYRRTRVELRDDKFEAMSIMKSRRLVISADLVCSSNYN